MLCKLPILQKQEVAQLHSSSCPQYLHKICVSSLRIDCLPGRLTWTCSSCTSSSDWDRRHKIKERPVFSCNTCKKEFPNQSALQRHMKSKTNNYCILGHPSPPRPGVCHYKKLNLHYNMSRNQVKHENILTKPSKAKLSRLIYGTVFWVLLGY